MASFLKKVLLDNIPLKLIALALAFSVWYTIGQEITDKVSMEVRYQVTLPPGTQWKIVGPSAWDVKATARGPYSDVQRLRTIPWPLTGSHTIDTTALPTDKDEVLIQVPVSVKNFRLPLTEVQFTDFDPKALDVRLARMDEKIIRVKAVVEGEAGEGYALAGTPAVFPSEVPVRGPRGVLKELKEIGTLPVILTGRTSSFTERKRIQTRVSDHELECDRTVTVEVTVREKPGQIPLPNVPVIVAFPGGFDHEKYRVRMSKDTLEVRIEGPKPLLALVDPSKVRLYAHVKAKVDETAFKGDDPINDNARLTARLEGFRPEEHSRLRILFEGKNLLFEGDDILYSIYRLKKE
ncbi:MAG: CdaR family protein [Planctomycetota bacterium]